MPVAKNLGMKRVLIAMMMLLSSAAAVAQQPRRPQLHINVQKPRPRVEIDIGMVRIHTHNANYRIAYLPFLAPLPYSYPRTTQEVPNALVLTGTELPRRPSHHP